MFCWNSQYSESYDKSAKFLTLVKRGDSQFNESMRWCGDMIWKKLVPGADAGVVASVVQFSGIKVSQFEVPFLLRFFHLLSLE